MSAERDDMIATIRAQVRALASALGRDEVSAQVIAAMAAVPRDAFVPPEQRGKAFRNAPLPIACGQTISQPGIVAVMTDLLEVLPSHRVLEIGTGSGYQAAILSLLAAEVCTIETLEPLAVAARARLSQLGYANVHVRHADGALGWPDKAPFDGIMVTAAARAVPPALVEQLKPGGRLVLPLGRTKTFRGLPFIEDQVLHVVAKDADGRISERSLLPVRFVPLISRPPP
ncbi:MAG: protein-L-isoaspartate(D-aspartate) O-methyltransferase [Alphaproteobacteria bacterium]|nr:protein-L-isoaspartate(D-aspartate) O-methyltransferase [Alphaproteobacteria bacterium]